MSKQISKTIIVLGSFLIPLISSANPLYQWLPDPVVEQQRVEQAQQRFDQAYQNPETVIKQDLSFPIAPDVAAQTPIKLSLREAILLALRYNPNVKNSEIDRIVNRYNLRVKQNEFEFQYALAGSINQTWSRVDGRQQESVTTGAILPEVSKKTSIGTKFSLSLDNQTNLNTINPTAKLKIEQPLLQGFGKDVTLRSLNDAYDSETSNQLQLRAQMINAVTQVINQYRQLIGTNNRITTAKNALRDAEKTLKDNQQRIAAGQLEPLGNVQQQSQVERLRLSLTNAINSAQESKQQLLQTIGLDPSMKIEVPNDVDLDQIIIPPLQQTIDQALGSNLDYLNRLISFRKANRALIVAKDNLRWRLDATAQASAGNITGLDNSNGFNNLINESNTSQSVGLQLKVPIQDLAAKQAMIQAKLSIEKERINLAAAERALVTDVRNQIRNLHSQAEQIRIAQRSLELAKQSYDIEIKKRASGFSSSFDVTNAQDQLISAKFSLIDSKLAYLLALSTLHSTLGTTLEEWEIELRN